MMSKEEDLSKALKALELFNVQADKVRGQSQMTTAAEYIMKDISLALSLGLDPTLENQAKKVLNTFKNMNADAIIAMINSSADTNKNAIFQLIQYSQKLLGSKSPLISEIKDRADQYGMLEGLDGNNDDVILCENFNEMLILKTRKEVHGQEFINYEVVDKQTYIDSCVEDKTLKAVKDKSYEVVNYKDIEKIILETHKDWKDEKKIENSKINNNVTLKQSTVDALYEFVKQFDSRLIGHEGKGPSVIKAQETLTDYISGLEQTDPEEYKKVINCGMLGWSAHPGEPETRLGKGIGGSIGGGCATNLQAAVARFIYERVANLDKEIYGHCSSIGMAAASSENRDFHWSDKDRSIKINLPKLSSTYAKKELIEGKTQAIIDILQNPVQQYDQKKDALIQDTLKTLPKDKQDEVLDSAKGSVYLNTVRKSINEKKPESVTLKQEEDRPSSSGCC